jgi:hypothetical protein
MRKKLSPKSRKNQLTPNNIFGLIGQNVLVKTATTVEISTVVAVISFLKEDTGWTKCVGKNRCSH